MEAARLASGTVAVNQKMPNRLTEVFHRWLAPECAGCECRSGSGPYCPPCLERLPLNDHACVRCAEPLIPSAPTPSLCAHCLTRMPDFDRVLAPLLYAPPVDASIHALKFRGDLGGARRLAHLLDHSLPDLPPPDVVIPVPLHPSRIRQRGFNQALEIARSLCAMRGWRLDARAVKRVLPTRPQLGLTATERRRNLRHAFAVQADLAGRRVLIVDDVLTTGATASALAHALRKAGAEDVTALAAARTPRNEALRHQGAGPPDFSVG